MYVDCYRHADTDSGIEVVKTFGPYDDLQQDFDSLIGDGLKILWWDSDCLYWVELTPSAPIYSGFIIRN